MQHSDACLPIHAHMHDGRTCASACAEEMVTIKHAANLPGVSVDTIRRRIRNKTSKAELVKRKCGDVKLHHNKEIRQ